MSNIKLTYDYTLGSIKVVSDSIDKINTKLAVILTISGVLVNFGKDLPGYSVAGATHSSSIYFCLSCYLMKLSAYILIISAIALALWGLWPATGGKIVLPEQLLEDEWNLADEENYLVALVKYLEKETLLVLNDIRDTKASRLDWAIRAIASAVVLLGLDEIPGPFHSQGRLKMLEFQADSSFP
ncbi:hypothetical protein ACQ4N7_12300 [Nodosilinea sp. AN01ver1]|uniref:hypothetical protein n=1 Tax=Nodosilinea sp. AN01ver1 TaxID=3423362 RepID=UPI003D31C07F